MTAWLSTDEGEVYTWGRGDDGRLGHGDNGWKFVPRLVEELRGKNIRQVTCGSYHTAAVTVSGDLYTWGGGMYGKLGHGNETGHSTPFLVETLKGMQVRQVACGSRHTVVLLENKDVYTWGDKENGVSGHGDTEGHQYLPCPVEELRGKNIVQISACGFHTAALSEFGEVFTFGEGKFGRLGHNSGAINPWLVLWRPWRASASSRWPAEASTQQRLLRREKYIRGVEESTASSDTATR